MFPYATIETASHVWTILSDDVERFWIARDGTVLDDGGFDHEADALRYIEEQDA